MVLSACGYRFAVPHATLVGRVKSVHVPVFKNRTAEPGAEWVFTRAARAQLARAGVLGGDDAEATLEGEVVAVSGAPFLRAPSLPRQPVFRLNVSVSLVLQRGEAVLGQTTVSLAEEFPSGADVLLTESNREAALKRLAEAVMSEGIDRLQATLP